MQGGRRHPPFAYPQRIQEFNSALTEKFKVGRIIKYQTVVCNGIRISIGSNGDVVYYMEEYFNFIHVIDIPRDRRIQPNLPCTGLEKSNFLSLTGSLNWLVQFVLPQASFAASHLQHIMGNLNVSCVLRANKILRELKTLQPRERMVHTAFVDNPYYLAFSDASHGKSSYGQTGYVSVLYLPSGGLYHVLYWHSFNQNRVAFSSIGS